MMVTRNTQKTKPKFLAIEVFKSNYCKVVFIVSLILSYFILPKNLHGFWWNLIVIVFMILFALNMTCLVRNIKERVKAAKATTNSIIGIIASSIGIIALQVCSSSGYFCSAGILMSLFSSILPHFLLTFLQRYSLYIIILSILFQLFSLRNMNCFKKASTSFYA